MKYAAVAAAIFAGDFFLKECIEKQEEEKQETEICRGRVILKRYHNKGAALNFMEKQPGVVRAVSGAIVLFVGIFWYLLLQKKENPMVLLGLSLLLGGGAGNFYDRTARGYVVDYFSFCTPWKKLNQVVFNLSDLCIFLGSLLVVLFGRKIESF
ncbi:MAG: signal peptidase II [Lachnospiraceae bacterium]|nr:signal peptidase II [Lachnospiraceae bacterium]